jgi:DNA-binding MarR family transcriptional regulator
MCVCAVFMVLDRKKAKIFIMLYQAPVTKRNAYFISDKLNISVRTAMMILNSMVAGGYLEKFQNEHTRKITYIAKAHYIPEAKRVIEETNEKQTKVKQHDRCNETSS